MIERRSFLKILGLAGLFPAAVAKESIAEPAPLKPVKPPKPTKPARRQRTTKALPFPECEVKEITWDNAIIDVSPDCDAWRRFEPGLETVTWELWIRPGTAAAVMLQSLKPTQAVTLCHHDKPKQETYKGVAYLQSFQYLDYYGVIKAIFVSTGPIEVTSGGRPVKPKDIIRPA